MVADGALPEASPQTERATLVAAAAGRPADSAGADLAAAERQASRAAVTSLAVACRTSPVEAVGISPAAEAVTSVEVAADTSPVVAAGEATSAEVVVTDADR